LFSSVALPDRREWNEKPLADGVFREYTSDYRANVIDIPVGPLEDLEYKRCARRAVHRRP
jgi:hypothetical protein